MTAEGLTPEELMAESAIALPDKEVVSILDLNADVDVAIDAASPIDLAAAANLNVAAPIDAAAGANVLSYGSGAQAVVDQGTMLTQNLDADAHATSTQVSGIDQGGMDTDGDEVPTDGTTDDGTTDGTGTTVDTSPAALLDGNLLNVNVNVDLDTDLAAPISGAVAANANVAAPINAGVAANIGSVDSDAVSIATQDAIIEQNLTGEAVAVADQDSTISQGDADAGTGDPGTGDSGTSDSGTSDSGTSGADSGTSSGGDSGTSSGGTSAA
ncbi:peptidoglycan-binding protein [Mycolicibacterium litorale]|uniref:peptidoglycan-binding protein n=1 Tax=Mycolicibacterium litorale TaxID=758802 RepID=UPI003CFA1731